MKNKKNKNGSILLTTIIILSSISFLLFLYFDRSITNKEIETMQSHSYQEYLYAHSYIVHILEDCPKFLWKLYNDNYYVQDEFVICDRNISSEYIFDITPELKYYPSQSTIMNFNIYFKDSESFYNTKVGLLNKIFYLRESIIDDKSNNSYQENKLKIINKIFENHEIANQEKFHVVTLSGGNYSLEWNDDSNSYVIKNEKEDIVFQEDNKKYHCIFIDSTNGHLIIDQNKSIKEYCGFIITNCDVEFKNDFKINGLIVVKNANILGKHAFKGKGKILVDGVCEMNIIDFKSGEFCNHIISYMKSTWNPNIIYFKR